MSYYAPLDTLKPIGPDIWIVDGPEISFYGIPFSTRMTVIRLENGDIFLHSPTKISTELREQVAALGPIGHLVSAIRGNGRHSASRRKIAPGYVDDFSQTAAFA